MLKIIVAVRDKSYKIITNILRSSTRLIYRIHPNMIKQVIVHYTGNNVFNVV